MAGDAPRVGVPSGERRALALAMVQWRLMPAVRAIRTYGESTRGLPSFLIKYCFRSCSGCGRDIGGYLAYYYRSDDYYHIECLGSRIAQAERSSKGRPFVVSRARIQPEPDRGRNGKQRPAAVLKALRQEAPRPSRHSRKDTEPPLPA